jgi:transcriptional regulator of acetoin/glycerol metabolism
MAALMEYPWPGNVRELRNVIERAVLLSPGPEVSLRDLPEKILNDAGTAGGDSLKSTLDFYEKQVILKRLAATGWQKDRTARDLGIDLATLYRKMKKLGIDK